MQDGKSSLSAFPRNKQRRECVAGSCNNKQVREGQSSKQGWDAAETGKQQNARSQ